MKINADTAISAQNVLLVPYDSRHVPRYHEWMSDPAIQEATASEPLTLEEEYENQESWRESHDKLTFILCRPQTAATANGTQVDEQRNDGATTWFQAGVCDAPDRMVGDINFFLYPWDDEDEEGAEGVRSADDDDDTNISWCVGEIDIMIAGSADRGQGLGKAAVTAFLHYIWSNRDAILAEYQYASAGSSTMRLKMLMAKIKATNLQSIALFKRLGFEQDGEVNYFGEVKMVLRDLQGLNQRPDGFEVGEYVRPGN